MIDGRYADRADAGRHLAAALTPRLGGPDVIVLGLPRGGVVVGAEVAAALGAPLDAWPVRKLGAPGRPEYAVGAIAAGGDVLVDEPAVRRLRIDPADLAAVVAAETAELRRRSASYRDARPLPRLGGRTAVVVDDGLATGLTMRAAARAVSRGGAAHLIVAVPVGPRATVAALAEQEAAVDEVVCPLQPPGFRAVGQYYADFGEVGDGEVRALLDAPAGGFPG